MANFYDDNEDLRFYVEKYIDWEALVELTELRYMAKDGFENAQEALEFYQGVLDMVGGFAAEEIAPHAEKIDREHPWIENGEVKFPPVLDNIFEQVKQLELHRMCPPRELGGMNCPFMLSMLTTELFSRADVSVAAHIGFHGGMAMAALVLSMMEGSTEFDIENACIKKTRFGDIISEIIAGEAWGCMDITEPGAGSDMAALTTRGEQDDEGNWFITGRKIFITSGNAKYHFVIARTEETKEDDAFAGLQGLSIFLVPTWKDAEDGTRIPLATFERLEEKLGHHGSATVTISFDRTPAHLIGKRGEGFKQMLLLMNNARIGVGFESLGVCEAAWRMARDYAAERPSMGKTIDQHEMIADYLDEMRTDIQAIRAICVESCFHEEMSHKIGILLDFLPEEDNHHGKEMEEDRKRRQRAARTLTPLVKYLAAEKVVEISRRCIQIHGGYGYSAEYGAEKLLRDAMVMPIYEGTSQIQSLMVTKDNLMGVLKDPRGFLRDSMSARWRCWFGASPLECRVAKLQALSRSTLRFLIKRIAAKKLSDMRKRPFREWGAFMKDWDPKRDFAIALLHAERLTRILADVAVCETLLGQSKRFPERAEVLARYLERAEPRCQFLRTEIRMTGKRLLDLLAKNQQDSEGSATWDEKRRRARP